MHRIVNSVLYHPHSSLLLLNIYILLTVKKVQVKYHIPYVIIILIFPCLREKKLFFVKTKKRQDLKERKASRFGEAADR